MKKLLLGSFIYFTFFLPDIAFACATCFGDPNAAATQGMNKAIITMLGITGGVLSGVGTLAWNPTQLQRDVLYKNNVNPIVNFPGRGTVLFGDKTYVSKPVSYTHLRAHET